MQKHWGSTTMQKLIGYRRVSTDKQGRSGLGLEGQDEALHRYARESKGVIIKTYTEVETGKRADRPELAKALAHARRAGAKLVVAKLDRLARNVAFTAALMDSGTEFVCCDMPHANRLTIHILAAVAEAEAKAISDRTKAALAAYKARGGRLGAVPGRCPISPAARARGAKAGGAAVARKADAAYADLIPQMLEWRAGGMSQTQIADSLNEQGHVTRSGARWHQGQVSRILSRFSTR